MDLYLCENKFLFLKKGSFFWQNATVLICSWLFISYWYITALKSQQASFIMFFLIKCNIFV